MIDLALRTSGPDTHRSGSRLDMYALHQRKINEEAIVAAAEPPAIVTASTDRDQKIVLAAKVNRGPHVGDVGAARHQARTFIDHSVVNFPRLLVSVVVSRNNLAPEMSTQLLSL
jgi:hypothetical protein